MNVRKELINSFQDTIHFATTDSELLKKTKKAIAETSILYAVPAAPAPPVPSDSH